MKSFDIQTRLHEAHFGASKTTKTLGRGFVTNLDNLKGKTFVQLLTRNGFEVYKHRGSHHHFTNGIITVMISIHYSKEIPEYRIGKYIRALGLR